jgi:flagella basal body P-ring formation protein FlgA
MFFCMLHGFPIFTCHVGTYFASLICKKHKHLTMPDKTMRCPLLLLLLTLLLPSLRQTASAADTPGFQSHDSILSLARSFMKDYVRDINGEAAEIQVGRLDARLRLHACDQDLEAFLPNGGRTTGNTTVGIRCPGTKPWSLYVPVTVNVYKNVVVTAESLPRNTLLNHSHLKVARRNLAKLPQGYFMDPNRLVGMKLKRNLGAGLPFTPNMVKAQTVIKRGQQVLLISQARGISVRMQGKAMDNGAAGDLIRVKNLSSKRIVEGTVGTGGEVLIGSYRK